MGKNGGSSVSAAIRWVLAVLMVVAGISGGAATIAPLPPAKAADLSTFQPGNIISDALFFQPNAMTELQIQAFLNSKVPSCAAGFTCLKDYVETTHTVSSSPMCSTYEGHNCHASERAGASNALVPDERPVPICNGCWMPGYCSL
jgi:hypothetical protein